jgi:hypothetical protein
MLRVSVVSRSRQSEMWVGVGRSNHNIEFHKIEFYKIGSQYRKYCVHNFSEDQKSQDQNYYKVFHNIEKGPRDPSVLG